MTTTALNLLSFWFAPDATTKPERKPEKTRASTPVFIGDAVTPWGDDTLLLALLRAQQDDPS